MRVENGLKGFFWGVLCRAVAHTHVENLKKGCYGSIRSLGRANSTTEGGRTTPETCELG